MFYDLPVGTNHIVLYKNKDLNRNSQPICPECGHRTDEGCIFSDALLKNRAVKLNYKLPINLVLYSIPDKNENANDGVNQANGE